MYSRQRRRFLRGSGSLVAGLLGPGVCAKAVPRPGAPGLPVSVVMWDNRAIQHYVTGDCYPEFRRMHRITVCENRPLGAVAPDTREMARARV